MDGMNMDQFAKTFFSFSCSENQSNAPIQEQLVKVPLKLGMTEFAFSSKTVRVFDNIFALISFKLWLPRFAFGRVGAVLKHWSLVFAKKDH